MVKEHLLATPAHDFLFEAALALRDGIFFALRLHYDEVYRILSDPFTSSAGRRTI